MNNATVAIMQPYLFPYLGYFSLIQASDIFVFYDDVNFINRGWINRNQILINHNPYTFSVPLSKASQNQQIRDVTIADLPKFTRGFIEQLRHAYRRAPAFSQGMDVVSEVLSTDTRSISDLAIRSIEVVYGTTGLQKTFLRSSETFPDTRGHEKADRLIAITRQLDANHYINAVGGMDLYDKAYFAERGVSLQFLKPTLDAYPQYGAHTFHPGLSVIDTLMNVGTEGLREIFNNYKLA